MIRTGVKPIIFLLNNSGYTIERCIRGKHRSGLHRYSYGSLSHLDGIRKYNDISNWDWCGLFKVLGDPEGRVSQTYTVRNKKELSELLEDERVGRADRIQLVEVLMEKLDAPRALLDGTELGKKVDPYAPVKD